ncbi:MAG: elongation factor G [Myxococcota bacterium]
MASTKSFPTSRIRNITLLGHGGSGKTALVDAMCHVAGATSRLGDPAEGTALTMFRPEEKSRGISLYCTPARYEWKDVKVNLLDTPGYLDFAGEVHSAVRVADATLMVVGATSGVEVGTERTAAMAAERSLPGAFVISMMDKENADFDNVLEQIKARISQNAYPVEIPIGAGDDFRGSVNLLSGRASIYKEGSRTGELEQADPPAEMADAIETARTELLEAIAATDDELLTRYLEGEEIPSEQILEAFKKALTGREIFPVFCASAKKTFGLRPLMDRIVEIFPDPSRMGTEVAKDAKGEEVELRADDGGPVAALVFKTTSEPHVGELSYFRLYSGHLATGAEVYNPGEEATEKLTHLAVPMGKDRHEVDEIHAGDIAVVARLKVTSTGDTLTESPPKHLRLEGIALPEPDTTIAIVPKSRADEDRLGASLGRLHEEDPTFSASYDAELQQTLARGLGELHIEVQIEKLASRYNVNVETAAPRIAFRETIRKEAAAQGRYKKQTGGRGQFGDCHIKIRPRARGEGYNFIDSIVGGVIPGKFIPAVDKGIYEAAQRGILAGYPVVDFEAEVYDGSYHAVDSSEMAFKVAGSMAFQKATSNAAPVILEPVMKLVVTTPSEYTGDIMGDITQRRGRVLGMDSEGDRTVIQALVPQAELFRYASNLRSMTQGRGHHTQSFHGYEEVPAVAAEKLIAEAEQRKAEKE